MARSARLLADAQWKKLAPWLPKPRKHRKGGRPWIVSRPILEGILWIPWSRARWQDLAEKYPHPSTCWRLRDWDEQGVWLNIGRTFLSEWNERQQWKWSESFLDGSFAPAKKGAPKSEKPSGARGRSGWWWSTAAEFLWRATLVLRHQQKPLRVVGDKEYDSDALRRRLQRRGILLIAPHRSNRHRMPLQDGRILWHHKRRWTVKRTFAWLGNLR